MKNIVLIFLLVFALSDIYSQNTIVGGTYYDLQTNNSIQRRIAVADDGKIIITYTGSKLTTSTYDDRGSGYALFDGTNWVDKDGTIITPSNYMYKERVEGETTNTKRCGWPNPFIVSDSFECIMSHKTTSDGLFFSKRKLGSTTWTTTEAISSDATWNRTVSSGNKIFTIFSHLGSNSVSNVPGGIDFIKSTDGGTTWTTPDSIPGINTDIYTTGSIGGDDYSIDAKGDTICILTGGQTDVSLYTSYDFGNTWNRTVIVNGNNYNPLEGDHKMRSRNDWSVLIGIDGIVHCFWGMNYTDGLTYFPFYNGIVYWNSTRAMDETSMISNTNYFQQDPRLTPYYINGLIQQNGVDGDNQQLRSYGSGHTGFPSAGVDKDGNIYLCYQMLNLFSDSAKFTSGNLMDGNGNFMNEVYLTKSTNNGDSWIGPYNVSKNDSLEDAYPSIARRVDSFVHIVYQQDELFGHSISENASTTAHHGTNTLNKIIYTKVHVDSILPIPDNTPPIFQFSGDIANLSDTLYFYENCDFEIVSGDTVTDVIQYLIDNYLIVSDNMHGYNTKDCIKYTSTPSALDMNNEGVYSLTLRGEDENLNKSVIADTTLKVVIKILKNDGQIVASLKGNSEDYIYLGDAYTDLGAEFKYENPCDNTPITYTTSEKDFPDKPIGVYEVEYESSVGGVKVKRIVNVGTEPNSNFSNEELNGDNLTATGDDTPISSDFPNTKYNWTCKGFNDNGSPFNRTITSSDNNKSLSINLKTITFVKKFDSLCVETENVFTARVPKAKANKKTTCKYLKYVENSSSINDIHSSNIDLVISPNPSNGNFQIELNGVNKPSTVSTSLRTIDGELIDSKTFNQIGSEKIKFDYSHLSNGIYFFNVEVNNQLFMNKIEIK